jgi:hypothetical protein
MGNKPKDMLIPYDMAEELCKTLIKMPDACENPVVWTFCKYVFEKRAKLNERENYKTLHDAIEE